MTGGEFQTGDMVTPPNRASALHPGIELSTASTTMLKGVGVGDL